MALSQAEIADLEDLAARFVGAFVKCGTAPAKYSVCGIGCFSLEEAVGIALLRCSRDCVALIAKTEQREILADALTEALEAMKCR